MMEIMTGGAVGLLLGIGLQRCGLTARYTVRNNMALQRRSVLRRTLMLVGWATVLTAFLCWLAVIDVDLLRILPLHAGTLAGAVLFGAAAGATGLLPGTVPGSIGGGRGLEGLCALGGCALGALLLAKGQPWLERLQGTLILSDATFFRVTLSQPYLFPGGFFAQGCVGGAFMAAALLIPKDPVADRCDTPEKPAPPETKERVSLDAEDVQADTVIALLPGEEPLTVDTASAQETQEDVPEETPPKDEADTGNEMEAPVQEGHADEGMQEDTAQNDEAKDVDEIDSDEENHLG